MEDPSLIACLYPADGDTLARTAIRMRENSARYIAPSEDTKPEYGSRESTVSLEDEEDKNPITQPGLQLTFNLGPKAGQGFTIGTDPNRCDIVLPKLADNKISRRHCVLTFDAKRRLILRDLSSHGTIVEYDGQGGEKRRTIIIYDDKGREKRHYFTWILSGSRVLNFKKIVIQIEEIKFQIIIFKHETYLNQYNDNVDRFLREANSDDELPFGALGIQSTTSTAHQSGAHTPTPQTPIYISQWRLGSGQFSIVSRVWDVSTGFVYASKEFFNMKESEWRKEASIMSQVLQLSNEYIVQFITLIESPWPRLILEYLPLGNLEDQQTQQRFSDQESLTILCQSLNALTAIHKGDIVHRDIKPENILVQSRNPLRIKFADFGLSKATADLQTFCGTHLYAAPEIYTTRRGTYYTKACDIWSLGVVVFKYAYGPLPKLNDRDVGLRWCKKIIKRVNDWDSDPLLDFLSTAMLVIAPDGRLPTRECWEQALQLSAPSQSRWPTPRQAYYASNWATPNATEAATFTRMQALQNDNPSKHETNTGSSYGTVDHYLTKYDQGQEVEIQQSLRNSLTERAPDVRETSNKRRNNTQQHSSNFRRSKRVQQKECNLDLPRPESVDATDIFGSDWLRNPNWVGSDVAALGQDVDEESSWLSNWTSFHSETPDAASAPEVSNEQNSDQGPASKEIDVPSEELDQLTRIAQKSPGETVAAGRVESQIIHQPDAQGSSRQVIHFRTQCSLICATDLIKASSKRSWPTSLLLDPYEIPLYDKEAFLSYTDGLHLATRLNLPIEKLRGAMNEKAHQIEISKDEAETMDTKDSLIVHIWPSRLLINATNLLAVRLCRRNQLPDLLTSSGIHRTHCRAYGMQGTYISYADGFRLCDALEISDERMVHIRNAMNEGWLGPTIHKQHEPSVDFDIVKSRMAQPGVARAQTRKNGAKKTRIHFSEAHRATLETAYRRNPAQDRTAQAEIADELGLEKDRIYIWFQNRRHKARS